MDTYDSAFQALADPTRRAILLELRHGPLSVGRVAERMPVSRPAVSQHLAVLKRAALVTERRAGTRRFYAVHADGLARIRGYLEALWDDVLAPTGY